MSVQTTGCRVGPAPSGTGNVQPLLHQIRHALANLLAEGKETCIDLRGMPLTPAEERQLLDRLGEGEVTASLDALGHSSIRETRFPGVWLCMHENHSGEVIGKLIEVTRIPRILTAQQEDMDDALARLTRELEQTQGTDRADD